MTQPRSYAEAGVDRDQEEAAVSSILEMIAKTYPDGMKADGHFAGSIPFGNHMLSLANDGVGSKLLLAQELGQLETIGIDAVAMCVNDLITVGSIPAAFVDYIAIRQPDKDVIRQIMKGLVDGCIEAEIPLVGGETATLPEVLTPVASDGNGFDVAGTALGIHEISRSITGSALRVGDKVLGIRSSGIHSNGLTLARQLVENVVDKQELLTPTRIYVKMVKALLEHPDLGLPHGMAHITGGGLTNLLRLGAFHYDLHKIDLVKAHPIFSTLQAAGGISNHEMYRTFNMGLGFVIIVDPSDEIEALRLLDDFFPAFTIGELREGNRVTASLDDELISYDRN